MVDLVLMVVPIFFGLVMLLAMAAPTIAVGVNAALQNTIFAAIITMLVWLLLDAVFLSTVGNTPGRAIFGIRVRTAVGNKLSFADALQRSAMVAIVGMGAGIPLVALFTQAYAHTRLQKTRSTYWDDKVGSVVTHSQWGAIRATVCTIVTLVAMAAFTILIAANK